MPRNLPAPMLGGVSAKNLQPCWLLDLTLVSGVRHVWSGGGSIIYSGVTYLGVGTLGGVGDVAESSEIRADGTSVQLSGIDNELLAESLADVQQGAPVKLWLATFDAGAIQGAYPFFVGTVDRPVIAVGAETSTIALALENRLANLQRATNRRYTAADQRAYHPDDTGFNWVEVLNEIALIWG